MNEYDLYYNYVSNGSIQKQEYDIGSYQDLIDSAIENLTCLQSYDDYEAKTMVNNSFFQ